VADDITQYAWQAAIRAAPDITGTRLLVLLTVGSYMKPDGRAHPSVDILAGNLDVNEKTVRRHLQWARENGWLEVKRGGRRGDGRVEANDYRASLPDIQMTDAELISTGHSDDRLSDSPPDISQDQEDISGVSTGHLNVRTSSSINHQVIDQGRDPVLDAIREALLNATGKTFDDERDWYARVRDSIGPGHHPNYYRKVITSTPWNYQPTQTPRYLGEPKLARRDF
jgi:hypothetical protein